MLYVVACIDLPDLLQKRGSEQVLNIVSVNKYLTGGDSPSKHNF
tara:strand:+ start:2370 stop:2501 length:132 start_codon:yes stop_codon:yes gene_type:complete